MTQHTPGPWTASGPSDLNGRYSVYAWGPLLYCDRAEDAHLIAAAPDLLDALKQCLAIVDAHRHIAGGDGDGAALVAREALAKATGAA